MAQAKYADVKFEPLAGLDTRIRVFESATDERGDVCEGYDFKQAASTSPLCIRVSTNSPIESKLRRRIVHEMRSPEPLTTGHPPSQPEDEEKRVPLVDMVASDSVVQRPPQTEVELAKSIVDAVEGLNTTRQQVDTRVDAEARKNPELQAEMDFNRRWDAFGRSKLAETSYLGEIGVFDSEIHYYLADRGIIDELEKNKLIPQEVAAQCRQALSQPLTPQSINELNKAKLLIDDDVAPVKRAALGLEENRVSLEPIAGLQERIKEDFGSVNEEFNARKSRTSSPFCVRVQTGFPEYKMATKGCWDEDDVEDKIREQIGSNPKLKKEMEVKKKVDAFTTSEVAKSSHLGNDSLIVGARFYTASPELINALEHHGVVASEDLDKIRVAMQNPTPPALNVLEERGLLHPKFVGALGRTSPSSPSISL